jgi:hypothetical protein
MSRRRCCCPCDTSTNCNILRDEGIDDFDPILVELTDDYQDIPECIIEPPKTCETILPNQYQVDNPGFGLDWDMATFLEPNCHCVPDATPIEFHIEVNQDCVDISGPEEPEKIACIVEVIIYLIAVPEDNGAGCEIAEADQTWYYIGVGPIDIRNGNAFEVPFDRESFGDHFLGLEPVCEPGVHPESVFIREV